MKVTMTVAMMVITDDSSNGSNYNNIMFIIRKV